jgi:signal transduction histidine kinase
VVAGVATLELARIHEHAVLALAPSQDFTTPGNGSLKRAVAFFTQTLIPLEADRRATRESNRHLLQRNATLQRHTAALARGNRRLEREVVRRKAGEVKIENANVRYRTLLLESQLMQDKLRQLTRQIISAQEEERKRISRELHDEVVQTLVGINVALSALGRGVDTETQRLRQKIARTQRLVETSVRAVHRFARELRPAVLDDLGLIPALHAYSKSLAEREKIRIQMTAFRGVEALSSANRTVLFRVAQEALNNVVRHAEATEIKIGLTTVPAGIRMEIIDNGKSFHVRKTLLAKNNTRLGLIGMKERIEMIGGSFAIESTPGTGTTVRTEIPFKPEQKLS